MLNKDEKHLLARVYRDYACNEAIQRLALENGREGNDENFLPRERRSTTDFSFQFLWMNKRAREHCRFIRFFEGNECVTGWDTFLVLLVG